MVRIGSVVGVLMGAPRRISARWCRSRGAWRGSVCGTVCGGGIGAGLPWVRVSAVLSGSVFPALEPLLPRVSKPVQYVGGELNAQTKPWESVDVRWALLYPDAYEVGLPNQGVMILYEVLNERADALAERCYAVWPDLEELMREHEVPAFTVDTHR